MSCHECDEAPCAARQGTIELLIEPREADLGEFSVRRALPSRQQRMVGPFVFFDHMGPATFPPGKSINVRPHPHIGIATITYLFTGEILHRDSLGVVQPIQRGAINLMVAGSGITHAERPGTDVDETSELHGIQSWIALPEALQEIDAEFIHYPASDLPEIAQGDSRIRLIMGSAFGATSPVKTFSRTLYLDCHVAVGDTVTLPRDEEELAFYVADGSVTCDGNTVSMGAMAVIAAEEPLSFTANVDSRIMIVGGENIGPRHIYWNFVSTDAERIEQAKDDWREQRFPCVPDDDEFIPLPD
ncbi:MAG: pirin family protein [Pseudomonadota bacterium]